MNGYTKKFTPKRGSQKEHDQLVANILLALGSSNMCRVWENKTGAAFRDGVMIRYGLVGSADILGLMRNGRFLAIEVKSGAAQQGSQQVKFMEMVQRFNGVYLLCRSVEDAVIQVKKHCET